MTRRLGRFTRRRRRTRQRGGNSLNIRYRSTRVNGQQLQAPLTQKQPTVTVPKGHTLIMFDPDAPAGTWLHWLHGAEGDYWPYQPTSPPSGIHRYIFRLVEGEPVKSAIKQSGIDAAAILPGSVKGEVMFTQEAGWINFKGYILL